METKALSNWLEWQDLFRGRQALGPTCFITTPLGLPCNRRPPRCHHLGADLAWKKSTVFCFGLTSWGGKERLCMKCKGCHLHALNPWFFFCSFSSVSRPQPPRLTASQPHLLCVFQPPSFPSHCGRPGTPLLLSSPHCSSMLPSYQCTSLRPHQTNFRGHRERLRRKIKVTE